MLLEYMLCCIVQYLPSVKTKQTNNKHNESKNIYNSLLISYIQPSYAQFQPRFLQIFLVIHRKTLKPLSRRLSPPFKCAVHVHSFQRPLSEFKICHRQKLRQDTLTLCTLTFWCTSSARQVHSGHKKALYKQMIVSYNFHSLSQSVRRANYYSSHVFTMFSSRYNVLFAQFSYFFNNNFSKLSFQPTFSVPSVMQITSALNYLRNKRPRFNIVSFLLYSFNSIQVRFRGLFGYWLPMQLCMSRTVVALGWFTMVMQ